MLSTHHFYAELVLTQRQLQGDCASGALLLNVTSKHQSLPMGSNHDDYYELADCQLHTQSSEHAEGIPFTVDSCTRPSHSAECDRHLVCVGVKCPHASQANSEEDLEVARQKACKYSIIMFVYSLFVQ